MTYVRPVDFVDEHLADGSPNPAYDPAVHPDLEAAVLHKLQDGIGAEIDDVRADANAALALKADANHGHPISGVTGLQGALDAKASARRVPLNPQTGTAYAAVVEDAGKIITMDNAAANTLTLPANTYAAEDVISIMQIGAGQTSIAAATGLTLDSEGGMRKIAARYTSVRVIFLTATRAVLEGSLAA